MFSGLLQEDLLKRVGNLAKSYFKQNYCHAFHTQGLPSSFLSHPITKVHYLSHRNSSVNNQQSFWILSCSLLRTQITD